MLTFFDFCSGIGGGRLGLEKAGMKCVGYCDSSRLAKITYNLLYDTSSEVFINNVKKVTKDNVPDFDVLIAGFPCQSFSAIGQKQGLNDERGQVIFHLAKIMEIKKPKYFILENVKGLVTHNKGKTVTIILSLLSNIGYKVYNEVLTTLDYGVPQNRKRVYFVGIRNDLVNSRLFKWPEKTSTPKLDYYFLKEKIITKENLDYFIKYLNNKINDGKYTLESILAMNNTILDTRMNDLRIYKDKMPTLRAQRDGIYYVVDSTIYQLTGSEALLFQGFPLEKINFLKDKVSERHLLMQAGNAMSVNVIKKIGESIISFEEKIEMENWKKFEINCTRYLNDTFGDIATFIHQGEENSTIPDILVKTKKNDKYYIEAKCCPAQCGQFVLLPNLEKSEFDYSPMNVMKKDNYSSKIINHMNQNFEAFKNAGTAGKDISFVGDQETFSNWIIHNYQEKNVRFIITNDYKIFNLSKFKDTFDISAKYRVKRSGSSSVGSKYMSVVSDYIQKNFNITSLCKMKDKIFLSSIEELNNKRFKIDKNEFMISKRDSQYEVRRLSNTFNANVIFSIKLKNNNSPLSNETLKKLI